jgi:hypothetical protein
MSDRTFGNINIALAYAKRMALEAGNFPRLNALIEQAEADASHYAARVQVLEGELAQRQATIDALNREIGSRDAAIAAAREALERIARRGMVFDANGTWSQEVNSIATAALKELEK